MVTKQWKPRQTVESSLGHHIVHTSYPAFCSLSLQVSIIDDSLLGQIIRVVSKGLSSMLKHSSCVFPSSGSLTTLSSCPGLECDSSILLREQKKIYNLLSCHMLSQYVLNCTTLSVRKCVDSVSRLFRPQE